MKKDNMNKGIHLRLSDELEDFIIRTADDNGLNKSAFTRAILIKAIKEYYPSYPKPLSSLL